MAEITKQRIGELQRGVCQVLLPHAEGLPASTVLKQMESVVAPTPFEAADYPNHPGVRRYGKIVRFSTIAVVKAGWLVKEKGQWWLTDEGRVAYKQFENPEAFATEARSLYIKWKKEQPSEDTPADDETTDAASTFEEAGEAAWIQISEYVQVMPPYQFQELVAALLRAMGYHVSWVAPPGPDRGIDIVAHTDPLGTSTPRIKVQVKRRSDKINSDGLRSFLAVLGDQDVGIFVSTGGFTSDAGTEARSQESRRVTLIDLKRLFDLWVEHYAALQESEKELLPLKPVYYLAPD